MSETTTARIDVTTFYPNDDVMNRVTDVTAGDAQAALEIAELRGLRVEVETVITVETRTPYVACDLTYAHTQLICGSPHCRKS